MTNHDESVEINHNPYWSYIPDHPYRILIIWGPGSSKNKMLLKMIKHQRPYIVKKYLLSKIHSNQSLNYLAEEKK